jgi:hypothetical protein
MVIAKRIQHAAAAVAAALALAGSNAFAEESTADTNADGATIIQPASDSHRINGVRIQIDNDLFAGRDDDRDYTGGMSITISGDAARDGLLSLDSLLARLDQLSSPVSAGSTHYARQVGLIAFTPSNTLIAEAQPNDRPYASLLFMSNGRVRVDADDRGAWSSTLTIGVLGLSASERLHDAVHALVGSESPRGYDNQISAGGEPTARYTLARHRLWVANASGTVDVKTTVQGSVGYLTEGSAAISMRVGRFHTPWWSFAPELTDYMAAPVPFETAGSGSELYFFAGARIKARAYNAFLQGQFRDSAVQYSFGEIEPLLVEAWVGVVTQLFEQTQLSYTLNYQTAELRTGQADRDSVWAGVQLAHAF